MPRCSGRDEPWSDPSPPTDGPKWAGYSKTIHYEITGAGRLDYQYADATNEGDQGDQHAVVKILSIDLGSH